MQKIKSLVQKMTLEEKAGQVTQLPSQYFEVRKSQLTGTETEIEVTDQKWLAGSILGKMDAESMIRIQSENMKRSRLKIPMMFMTDIIHGYQTIFPTPLAMSCSFNPELIEKSAEVAAKEGSAAGYQVTFSPMVDLVRDPRWGRVMESFGEDRKLNIDFGKAMVRGYQGKGLENPESLAACAKHFAAYGAAQGGRDYCAADVSEYTLRNQYFPPFQACIQQGVKLMMSAFQSLNGVPVTANRWLLNDILRKEFQYDGIVISDWGAVLELIQHGVAESEYEAGELALRAGVQIEMSTTAILKNIQSYIKKNPDLLVMLDAAVEKILILKEELGLFKDPYRRVEVGREKKELRSKEKRQVSLAVARESCVLLENQNILPLNLDTPVIVAGPYADSKAILGPWSVDGVSEDVISISDGIRNRGGNIQDIFPVDFTEISDVQIEKILKRARKEKSIVLLALGEPESWSGEAGSRSVIELPEAQCKLLKTLHENNIRNIVLLFNGRPLDLRNVKPYTDAILEAWFPGTEGGNAVADILYGKENPSGHLTMSFPYGSGQIPVYYNMGSTGRPKEFLKHEPRYKSQYLDIPNEPFYEFGYGLSYTKFKIEFHGNIIKKPDENYIVPVKVTNVGEIDGKAVVQVYIRKKKSQAAKPAKELAAYCKKMVRAGESICMEIPLSKDVWYTWLPKIGWKKECGVYQIMAQIDRENCTSCYIDIE